MTRALLCLLLVGVTACERDPRYDRALAPGPGRALQHHVTWVLPAQRRLAVLRVTDLALRFFDIGAEPIAVETAPEAGGLLIVDPAGALWFEVVGAELSAPVRFATTGQYRRVAFSPDGQRVVLFDDRGGTGATLRNPNQIAILDLETGGVVERTIRSYGSAPQAVRIAPAADGRQLAWLLAERYLAVIDLTAPEAREVVAQLVLPGDPRDVTPLQLEFGVVDGAPATFVRAEGSDDVFTLTFPEAAAADTVPRPYLNQIPVIEGPTEMRVEPTLDGLRVFTCSQSMLAVTHPVTGQRTVVDPGGRVDHLLPFRGARSDDLAEEGQFALLWSAGSRRVLFADLDLLERRRERALTPLTLSASITEVHPLPGRQGAVARLGQSGLALLDFDARTATPLTANGSLLSLVVQPDGARIHALLQAGRDAAVVSIDVDTGASRSVSVPAGAISVQYLPLADRLAVIFNDPWGRLHLIDEGEVIEREGFLLEGGMP